VRSVGIHYAVIVDFVPGIVQVNNVIVQIPGIMRMMRINEINRWDLCCLH